MKTLALSAAALMAAAPLAAQPSPQQTSAQTEVIAAVEAFFDAIGNPDKTALAGTMDPEGMIYIHDRMDPAKPEVGAIPTAQHLANWAKSPLGLWEKMVFTAVLVDGDIAQVWGPYRFMKGGKTSHCGIDSLSLVKRADGWKIANTSFTMVPPADCDKLGAPKEPRS